MIAVPVFATFHDAYLAVLRHVTVSHEFRNAPRGNAARECLNVSFSLSRPHERIVWSPARRANVVFCFAEALWYLSGRDDLEMISYYAPRLARYSADGTRLTGSAYGPKIFTATPVGPAQWDQVLGLLASDPDSKRAVVSLFRPDELRDAANPDVSCTLALQLLLREGRLHAVTYMRGNDAVTGLLCDVFSFTLLQEFTARQLGVPLGTYGHHVGSMHVNDADAGKAARILDQSGGRDAWFPGRKMPPTTWADIRAVARLEEALRRDQAKLTPADAAALGLHPYWQQVVLLFEVYRQITRCPHMPVRPATLAALDPGYQWLTAHRWPGRIPPGFSIPQGGHRP